MFKQIKKMESSRKIFNQSIKTKSLLLTVLATLGLTATTLAQTNCDLINSATFTVPNQLNVGAVTYSSPFTGNWSYWSDCQVTLNNWIYVAYTKDQANNSNLYFNGNLIKTSAYQNLPYSWNSLRLGTDLPSNPNQFFNGQIDELRISNIVRSSSEIASYFGSNQPFVSDASTIALYNFNQSSGSVINATAGPTGNGTNTSFSAGVYGNSISFNGINSYADFSLDVPETNLTVEFWLNVNSISGAQWVINYPGIYSAGFELNKYSPNYTWSTGAMGNSVTVDPTTLPYIFVSNENCTDTIWFNSQSATTYDTTYVTVTDTLVINTSVTGINPPNNINAIKVFPNPASTHVTIDYGSFTIMNGYQLVIENSLGQQVFQTNISQQSDHLNIANWGGNGLYFVHIIDSLGNIVDIRKIVLQ
tara:strand:+ start:144 stop:1397 length:1254 start_codon:yes stop_codon:yes gene_type:complete